MSFRMRNSRVWIADAGSQRILLPIYTWWQLPYYYAGCKLYDILAGKENMESAYWMGKGKALEAFPMLKTDGLVGGVVYYDGERQFAFVYTWSPGFFFRFQRFEHLNTDPRSLGQHNDSRMNISLIMTAVQHGAVVANHTEVTKLHKKYDASKDCERIYAATVKDRMTDEEFVVKCRVSSCPQLSDPCAFLSDKRYTRLAHGELISHSSGHRKCDWSLQ